MADLTTIQALQKETSGVGSGVGAVLGLAVGNPAAGAFLGGVAERAIKSVIPEFSSVKGSVTGVNFVRMGLKPYQIVLVKPSDLVSMSLSDAYTRWGCATNRIEPLNISSYLYNGIGYVRGELDYNGSIPMDKFNQINNIFKNGCTVMG